MLSRLSPMSGCTVKFLLVQVLDEQKRLCVVIEIRNHDRDQAQVPGNVCDGLSTAGME